MKLFSLLIVACAMSSAMAQSKYTCTSNDFDSTVNLSVTARDLKVTGDKDLAQTFGKGDADFDSSYKPRPQHAGAHRYNGSNSCGGYALIIDKNMVDGKAGHMTFSQDCDSDGTGPSFINFQCK